MTSFPGVVTIETRSGDVVLGHATIEIVDSRTARCPYLSRPAWWGTLEQDGADLMGEPWRTDPECVVKFDTGDTALARFNGWDKGGRQAKIIGDGPWPVTDAGSDPA